jgi:hypothetical protein
MTNGQHNFTGTLDKYTGGQCISCAYSGRPTLAGNDGTVSIAFASETSATLTLPGGRTTQIQPFNFGIGTPPTGLLGEWIFVYDAGTTLVANRYDLTTVLPPSSGGNGIAFDSGRLAGCELQTTGGAAGLVVCAVVNAAGVLQFGYVFVFGLDQTYSGVWETADGGTVRAMKGFKIASRSGFANSSGLDPGATSTARIQRAPVRALDLGAPQDQAMQAAVAAVVNGLHRALGTQ